MGFQRVIEILDESIDGQDVGIGMNGAFRRGLTRDQFVAKKVFGGWGSASTEGFSSATRDGARTWQDANPAAAGWRFHPGITVDGRSESRIVYITR
jgi:hypothetical protein